MITPNFQDAIIALYPQAAVITGDTLETCVVKDVDGNVVTIDDAAVNAETIVLQNQSLLDLCKSTASKLLYETDWTTIPDVANPINNPYLLNQADFVVYRNTLRQLAVHPVTDPVFPTKPTEQWSQ